MPDYQSKDGKLYAISKNGTEVILQIKGINWYAGLRYHARVRFHPLITGCWNRFGMETKLAIPFGLWENANNGTTAVRDWLRSIAHLALN